jgi:hypothetical protein
MGRPGELLSILDDQMRQWTPKLSNDLGVDPAAALSVATAVMKEVAHLPLSSKVRLKEKSVVPLELRLEEIVAFQMWMDLVRRQPHPPPEMVRAQVIAQNYVCFVYLGEAWFKALREIMPPGTVTRKLCQFLTDNPVRAFRNALAHGNWRYAGDYGSLIYWARKGSELSEPLVEFSVEAVDLDFWQSAARCTAYSSFLSMLELGPPERA